MKTISMLSRMILSAALSMAVLATNGAATDVELPGLSDKWVKFTVSSRIAEYAEIQDGESVILEKAEMRSVKSTVYAHLMGEPIDAGSNSESHVAMMYADLGNGLEVVGEGYISIQADTYLGLLIMPILEKRDGKLESVGYSYAYINGIVARKVKDGELKSAAFKQLGGMSLGAEIETAEGAERLGLGTCRVKGRMIAASKVPPLAE